MLLRAIVVGVLVAFASAVEIKWYSQAGCSSSDASITTVNTVAGQCNVVPGAPTTGYRVDCDPTASNGGGFQAFADAACSAPSGNVTSFQNNACIAQPTGGGSSSVKFDCTAAAPSGSNGAASVAVTAAALAGVVGAALYNVA